MRRLIAHRVILDRKMLYWYARPSEHLPNLEVRIADTNADADVPLLLAILLRATRDGRPLSGRLGRRNREFERKALLRLAEAVTHIRDRRQV